MLFRMSTIIWKWYHTPHLINFRYSRLRGGHSQPRVAYKRVAYKRKSVNVCGLSCTTFSVNTVSLLARALPLISELEFSGKTLLSW